MYTVAHVCSLIVLGGIIAAAATPLRVRSEYCVKEHHNVPPKWNRISDAPLDHLINLQIGLKQSRFDELERQLYQGEAAVSYV